MYLYRYIKKVKENPENSIVVEEKDEIKYDEEKELNVNGIKITVMPIWKWLIEN